jgi:hypothetical protein
MLPDASWGTGNNKLRDKALDLPVTLHCVQKDNMKRSFIARYKNQKW